MNDKSTAARTAKIKPENASQKNSQNVLLADARSVCPVSCALDILGDKWTLIVIRDMLLGAKTYGQLQRNPESIPTNILAARLKKLEAADLIAKQLYQTNPKRYEYHLTEKGKDLTPMMLELVRWGLKHVPGTVTHPKVEPYL
ncbi:MAG: helix-turn-helix transcriptional regulator [Pseudomonadales bacterium]|nr:helix-turn-helix transcriptional regulator [Pseudomonadales bacterium]